VKYFFPLSVLGFAIILFLSCTNNSSLKYPDKDDWFQYDYITYEEQKYKTIKIGEQVWMAENLNKEADSSKCYDGKTINCGKYGRLYNWETARNICPDGWHLPSNDEWKTLIAVVGSPSGTRLKADSVWNEDYNNGTNAVGFAALPGGRSDSTFYGLGDYGVWWTSVEDNQPNTYAYTWSINYDNKEASGGSNPKSNLYSVRCVEGED
jgi:uncharacterized protein (TIGR02145 family)